MDSVNNTVYYTTVKRDTTNEDEGYRYIRLNYKSIDYVLVLYGLDTWHIVDYQTFMNKAVVKPTTVMGYNNGLLWFTVVGKPKEHFFIRVLGSLVYDLWLIIDDKSYETPISLSIENNESYTTDRILIHVVNSKCVYKSGDEFLIENNDRNWYRDCISVEYCKEHDVYHAYFLLSDILYEVLIAQDVKIISVTSVIENRASVIDEISKTFLGLPNLPKYNKEDVGKAVSKIKEIDISKYTWERIY